MFINMQYRKHKITIYIYISYLVRYSSLSIYISLLSSAACPVQLASSWNSLPSVSSSCRLPSELNFSSPANSPSSWLSKTLRRLPMRRTTRGHAAQLTCSTSHGPLLCRPGAAASTATTKQPGASESWRRTRGRKMMSP